MVCTGAAASVSDEVTISFGELPDALCSGFAPFLPGSLTFLGFTICSRSMVIFRSFFFGVILTRSTAMEGSSLGSAPRKWRP